ncbi:MAG: hypothetical protein LBV50_11400 [Novosphingobium sp.]|jgi:hypothetical protein|nr:hypothetical protein [Novosphingobium sp.]
MTHRDAAIVAAWLAGESRGRIGAAHGLTPRRVSQIVAARGATRDQASALIYSGRRGRPRLAIPAGDQAHYVKLRRVMGAAYARAALGIGA